MTCKDGRFNTGNKLCSNDLRDLNDNSIIVDGYVNSQDLYVEDRLGVERLTLAGIEKKVSDKIIAQGGVEITNEFGDSPEKVISQKKISEHLSDYTVTLKHSQGDSTIVIQSLIDKLHGIGGGVILLEPKTYTTSGTVYLKRGVHILGTDMRSTIHNTSTSSVVESYKFNELLSSEAWSIEDNLDMTTDYSVRRVTLLGNGYDNDVNDVIYGLACYGRRYTVEEVTIANVAGVGFRSELRGSHTVFEHTQSKAVFIDRLDVIDTRYEGVVIGGNSDLTIGAISTNNTGLGLKEENGILPKSLLFPNENINGFVCDRVSIRATTLNLNGAHYGWVFSTRGNAVRLYIDSLITAGGWGLLHFNNATFGHIESLRVRANVRKYANEARPYILNESRQLTIGHILADRIGTDTQAPIILDKSSLVVNSFIMRNPENLLGDVINVDGNGGVYSLLIDKLNVESSILKVLNSFSNIYINLKMVGDVPSRCILKTINGVSNVKISGVIHGTVTIDSNKIGEISGLHRASYSSLLVYLHSNNRNGDRILSSQRFNIKVDTTESGIGSSKINHNLWFTPIQEDIQLSARSSGSGGLPQLLYYLESFNHEEVGIVWEVQRESTRVTYVNIQIEG